MLQELILILAMFFSLGMGCMFLVIFSLIVSSISRSNATEKLADELRNTRMAMNAEQIRLLYKIGRPDLKNGGYSEGRMELWNLYWEKENQLNLQFENDMMVLYG